MNHQHQVVLIEQTFYTYIVIFTLHWSEQRRKNSVNITALLGQHSTSRLADYCEFVLNKCIVCREDKGDKNVLYQFHSEIWNDIIDEHWARVQHKIFMLS